MSKSSKGKKTPPHGIEQPPLRDLRPNERYVKTAGLTFILPNVAKEGDVLSAKMAAFLNVAYHTAVINRFGPIRQVLLESPQVTYEDLDIELRAFFDTCVFSTRPNKAPDVPDPEAIKALEEFEALVSFARPLYRATLQGAGYKLERKDYESVLRSWVLANRERLQALFDQSQIELDEGLFS